MDGSGSTDPEESEIAAYHWIFRCSGDQTPAEGALASHTFSEPGRHAVSLVVVTADQRVSPRLAERVDALCPSLDVSPWAAAEVGEPLFPGAARFLDSGDGAGPDGLALCAGPYTVDAPRDGWFFVYQEMAGNFRLTARVSELLGAEPGATVALLARGSLAGDALFAGNLLRLELAGTGSLRLRYRLEEGDRARYARGRATIEEPAAWLRLVRRGSTFLAEYSLDGEAWTEVDRQELDQAPPALEVGVAAVGAVPGPTSPLPREFRALQVHLSGLELESLPGALFLRGDCDGQTSPLGASRLTLTDAVRNFRHCFAGVEVPCRAACDATGDGDPCTGVTDGIRILDYLFRGTDPLPAPFPMCGPSDLPGDLELGCEEGGCS